MDSKKTTKVKSLSDALFHIVIPGRPYVKKNGQKVVRRGNFTTVVYTKNYRFWESVATQCLLNAPKGPPIDFPVNMKMIAFFKDRQAEADLSALYEGIQDCLQKSSIIQNDKWIHAHDGSRKIFYEEPRMEITLTRL